MLQESKQSWQVISAMLVAADCHMLQMYNVVCNTNMWQLSYVQATVAHCAFLQHNSTKYDRNLLQIYKYTLQQQNIPGKNETLSHKQHTEYQGATNSIRSIRVSFID